MNDPSRPESAETTEERLRKVTIGERKPVNRTIELVDYDVAWPRLFDEEAIRIRASLGDRALRIEHVGSTSVPGLAAKPIIDIVLAVADTRLEPAYVPALESTGYVLRIREPEWFEHRLFKGPRTNVNIHCFSDGCVQIERMVIFRDWLRTHESERRLYEQTKRRLAAKTWKFTQDYADAKTSIVEEILGRAQLKR
jgi:GrpB-like predicted nucleotidyltransferase (UPF0157 family)